MKLKKITGNNITAKVKSQLSSPQRKTTPKKKTLTNSTIDQINKIKQQVEQNKTTISKANKKIEKAIKNDGQPPAIDKNKQKERDEKIVKIKKRSSHNLSKIEKQLTSVQNQANNALSKPADQMGGGTKEQIIKERDSRVAQLQKDYAAEEADRDSKIKSS